MCIPRIGRVITICGKVLFKIGVYFDVLVGRKKVLSESSHHIESYIDAVLDLFQPKTVTFSTRALI